MPTNNHIKTIALVGASGNIGTSILSALLATATFKITLITRTTSPSTFPSHASLTLKRGSYDDPSFLAEAFSDVDAAIFALHFMAMGEQTKLIDAAAKAGVKWILPTEYAADGMDEGLVESVPLLHPKRQARKQVEELAGRYERLKWIGVATNPWFEFSMQRGLFGFDTAARTAKLYSDSGLFNSTTLPQAGRGIARLLSLPIENPSNPRASLSHYANNFAYMSSFLVSQKNIFEILQRVSGTSESDWTIERSSIAEWEEVCKEGLRKGDMRTGAGLVYCVYMGEGKGGNYEAKAREDREILGLEEENLEDAVKRAVEGGEAPPVAFNK